MAIENYLIGDTRDQEKYVALMSRGGLTKMPPLIITCAITGGLHGQEANPALPEMLPDQVQSAYDAYNAGASMIHIHRRNPENPMLMSQKWEEFAEINAAMRAKMPDVIINNTCIGGRLINEKEGTVADLMTASIKARPEIASLDIHCFCEDMPMKARKAPLFGRDEDGFLNFHYSLCEEDAEYLASLMKENDVKPEFEMYDIADVKYIRRMEKAGVIEGPYWCSMLFNGNGTIATPEMVQTAINTLPANSLLNVIGIGAAQFPMLALGMIFGQHVRVGLEDNVTYGPHQLAESNAQMVERVVRLAEALGRRVATPAEAREMIGLGAPRSY